jgi:methylated-DNA-protein-cysteine methyltransferase-like protein
MPPAPESLWELYYRVIRKIPRGKVATYGRVAEWSGKPRTARHVGYALAALGGKDRRDVPWQRVLGTRGKGFAVVTIRDPMGGAVQRQLLEREKVRFDERGRIDLARFGWPGPSRRRPSRRSRSESPDKVRRR